MTVELQGWLPCPTPLWEVSVGPSGPLFTPIYWVIPRRGRIYPVEFLYMAPYPWGPRGQWFDGLHQREFSTVDTVFFDHPEWRRSGVTWAYLMTEPRILGYAEGEAQLQDPEWRHRWEVVQGWIAAEENKKRVAREKRQAKKLAVAAQTEATP